MLAQIIRIAGLASLITVGSLWGVPVWAQQKTDPVQVAPGPSEHVSEWESENFERQQFREEMEQIRKEHEDLERASDALLDQCVNIHDQQKIDACQKEKQALHERRAKLHERTHALHEKMDAARQEEGAHNAQLHEEYHSSHSQDLTTQGGISPSPPVPATTATPLK